MVRRCIADVLNIGDPLVEGSHSIRHTRSQSKGLAETAVVRQFVCAERRFISDVRFAGNIRGDVPADHTDHTGIKIECRRSAGRRADKNILRCALEGIAQRNTVHHIQCAVGKMDTAATG